jgi:hypothetical protein
VVLDMLEGRSPEVLPVAEIQPEQNPEVLVELPLEEQELPEEAQLLHSGAAFPYVQALEQPADQLVELPELRLEVEHNHPELLEDQAVDTAAAVAEEVPEDLPDNLGDPLEVQQVVQPADQEVDNQEVQLAVAAERHPLAAVEEYIRSCRFLLRCAVVLLVQSESKLSDVVRIDEVRLRHCMQWH